MMDYFSHIPILHLLMHCTIFVGDVTEPMFIMARTTETLSQLFVGQNITALNSDKVALLTMNKRTFYQDGFTRTTLSATASRFVEENEFLFTHALARLALFHGTTDYPTR